MDAYLAWIDVLGCFVIIVRNFKMINILNRFKLLNNINLSFENY